MSNNKIVIYTQKNKVFEYDDVDSAEAALDRYLEEELGFNKKIKISSGCWETVKAAIQCSFIKINLINGLCKNSNDAIKTIIVKNFAYSSKFDSSELIYDVVDESYETVWVENSLNIGENLQIVDSYRGLPVVGIKSSAFKGCEGLTSITIPVSVEKIGESAFEGCDNLTTIYYKGTEEQWTQLLSTSSDCGLDLSSITVVYEN